MKHRKTMIALITVGLGASLTLAGCTSDEPTKTLSTPDKTASPTAEATPSASATPREDITGTDAEQITATYEIFSAEMFGIDPDNANNVLNQHVLDENSTDADKQAFIEAAKSLEPQAWELVDLSPLTSVDEELSYVASITMMAMTISSSEGEYSVTIDPAQIVVDGDRATVPAAAIVMSIDGEPIGADNSAEAPITFTKTDGVWRLEAAPVSVTGSDS